MDWIFARTLFASSAGSLPALRTNRCMEASTCIVRLACRERKWWAHWASRALAALRLRLRQRFLEAAVDGCCDSPVRDSSRQCVCRLRPGSGRTAELPGIDDDHRRSIVVVTIREEASFQKGRPKCQEIIGTNPAALGRRSMGWIVRTIVEDEARVHCPRTWQAVGERSGSCAGNARSSIDDVAPERISLRAEIVGS
jgi:hypothetical protein